MANERPQLTALQKAYLKLEELQARLSAAEGARREPIAIVGLACRLPGDVTSPEEYWELLSSGRDAISEIPRSRWDVDAHFDPDPEAPGKMHTRWGGFLRDVERFDAQYFGISPREAVSTDPQQRLLLELAVEALEHAGIAPDSLAGSRTGVFAGVGFNDYARLLAHQDASQLSAYSGSGVQLCFCSGRVSFALGLRGPSLSIDTACSSSLVALHHACQSLRTGDCDLALSAGVNLLLAPEGNVFLSKAGALSPDGRCKTFDASADGMVRSEGCGVVVLRRLSDALAAGDRIWAVLRGSAVNHDGRSSGLTVPSGPAQEAVMRQALRNAGLEPHEIDYVEAHGTGTTLGDPIEMQSTAAVYGGRPAGVAPLVIGSVKTNIGHSEAASGVTSVIKVVLMLQQRRIAPHLHFRALNPHATLEPDALRVPVALEEWRPRPGQPRRAGVSAFGLSGTNVHVLIEEPPAPPAATAPAAGAPLLLALSARKPAALTELAARHVARLEALPDADWYAWCRTAAIGRAHHDHRLAVLARSRAEALHKLRGHAEGQPQADVVAGRRPLDAAPRLAFVFSGQGTQWARMGLDLFEREPVFRAALEECDAALRPHLDRSVIDDIAADEQRSRLGETEVAQPALFAFQVALAALLRAWGLEPDAVVGHSLGEVTAAYACGALDLEQAARLVAARGRVMQRLTGLGRMLAAGLSADAARARLAGLEGRVALAAVNSPASVVLSGETAPIEELFAGLQRERVFTRLLAVSYASHSPQTRALADDLRAALRSWIQPQAARIPFYSTVGGAPFDGARLDAEYWVRNMAEPVLFGPAVERMCADGWTVFVDVAPHSVLTVPLRQTFEALRRDCAALATLDRDADTREALLRTLAGAYARGVTPAFARVFTEARPPLVLPTYPWQRRSYWLAESGATANASPSSVAPGEDEGVEDWLYRVEWEPRPAPAQAAGEPGTWLVLRDRQGVGDALVQTLTSQGHTCTALHADELPELRDVPADDTTGGPWRAVLERLFAPGAPACRGIVHLWSLDATPREQTTPASLLRDQHLGARSAVQLIQALAQRTGVKRPPLWLVTRGAQAVGDDATPVAVAQAPLWAVGRTCAAEHPDLWGGLADLDPAAAPADAVRLLLDALLCGDREDHIAFRGGQRYVGRLAHYRVDPPAEPLRVRSDAAYLITGGLDGVGLEVARWLAAEGARHLILLGRTPIPPRAHWDTLAPDTPLARRVDALRTLEARGVAVQHPALDVADEPAMRAFFDGYRQGGQPPIAGVFHAASVWRGPDGRGLVGPLAYVTPLSFDHVLPPKIVGSWLLQELVPSETLDFVMFFSSGAALIGSAGQGNYGAANAFMDALAHDLSRRKNVRALAVDWGPVTDTGFGITAEGRAVYEIWERRGVLGMPPRCVTEALSLLLPQRHVAQVGVMRTDWSLLQRAYAEMLSAPWTSLLVDDAGGRTRSDLPALLAQADPADRHELLARALQQQVVAVMGFDPADAPEFDQGLFDIGLSSLLALDLKNHIQAAIRQDFSVTALFDHPTIGSLATYLLTDVLRLSAGDENAGAAAEGRDVLTNIEELSEEDVERMLAERVAGGRA